MSGGATRFQDYLGHILDAIDRIQRYTAGIDEAAFVANELVQDAVIRNLEIIGEASRNVQRRYPNLAARHSNLPFISAYEMRNALSHGYFSIDLGIIWETVQRDLPGFSDQVRALSIETKGTDEVPE